ncbi:His-Xaa-Ser system radical SAM maturase HxsC [Aeromonas hydrophila]|uniref:His-Xaa-Ser system radical SAM maturase HxsC n=1 Tax=Aeromonas hydrophila TaxID=644 RepID=UPI00235E9A5C|nr:His-Xaa-Ser system radical SAM maturase HxsC [Aeromonas hydrophila]WDA22814.1 His-Xaa-Ser system radical SAM maturase HxsC [Aeromonas hydrophila]WES92877.1 His-Xaa-Ser system radical SAM maturase HxsC [Aeromonas hydrophila]
MSFKLKLKAEIHNPSIIRRPLRVTTIESYVANGRSPEDLCLIYPDGQDQLETLLSIKWGAVFIYEQIILPFKGQIIQVTETADPFEDGDIIVVLNNAVYIVYKQRSDSNTLFLTERCDNFCIMCSQPPKDIDDSWRVNDALGIINLLDDKPRTLGVSGGEPTILGADFLKILRRCHEKLPQTQLHILTNGKKLSDRNFINNIRQIGHQQVLWGIPLYGSTALEHDYHVQSRGAFNQTIDGLYHIETIGQHIELRIVLTMDVLNNIEALCEFISRNLSFVSFVAFMGVELTGFAKRNYAQVYSSITEYLPALISGVNTLKLNGIQVLIYNIPQCHLPLSLRVLAVQSISDWKNEFPNGCDSCVSKSICCGFFESNLYHKFGVLIKSLNGIDDECYIEVKEQL